MKGWCLVAVVALAFVGDWWVTVRAVTDTRLPVAYEAIRRDERRGFAGD